MMRALTLTQPWAGLVASGIKLVENRPRAMIKRADFGKPFAIHASRVIDPFAIHASRVIDPNVYATITQIAPWLAVGECNAEHHDWYRLSQITRRDS